MNKGFRKKNNGITLIALVITIIILLILAGICLTTLVGNNGILNRAINATVLTDISGVTEEVRLDIVAKQMDNDNYDGITEEEYIEILEKYGSLEYTDSVIDGTLTTKKGNKIKVSDIYDKIIITPHYITAEDVQNDPKTYYGKVVETGGNQGNLEEDYEWEIFYSDGTNIYLIAKDYINNNDAPEKNGKSVSKSGSYGCYFTNIYSCYKGYLGISNYTHANDYCWNSAFCETWGDTPCTYVNTYCVSYMLDHEIWEDKFSGQFQSGVVEYIIGGPTLEQFLEAYNDLHRDMGEEYVCIVKSGSYGYQVKLSSEDSYGSSIVLDFSYEVSYLFGTDRTDEVGAYWISSPCHSDNSQSVRGKTLYEVTSTRFCFSGTYNVAGSWITGFRPLVSLKSTVKLLESNNENGELEYEIVK